MTDLEYEEKADRVMEHIRNSERGWTYISGTGETGAQVAKGIVNAIRRTASDAFAICRDPNYENRWLCVQWNSLAGMRLEAEIRRAEEKANSRWPQWD